MKSLKQLLELQGDMHQLGGVSVRTNIQDSRPPSTPPLPKRTGLTNTDLQTKYAELQNQLETDRKHTRDLREQIQKKQERYVKRQQEYRKTIAEYQNKLKQLGEGPQLFKSAMKNLQKMNKIHDQIQKNIQQVQIKTTYLLKDQQQHIVKKYNTRLNQKNKELNLQKAIQLQGLSSISQKEQKLMEELQKRKASVQSIESTNKILHKQNAELKIQLLSQESEQPILENKLHSLKQKNIKLKQEVSRIIIQPSYSKPPSPPPQPRRRPQSGKTTSEFNRFQIIISKLKRMLQLQRKNVRAAKTAYARQLQAKKELEQLLKDCVDDVKNDITKKRAEQRLKQTSEAVQEIQNIIEVLLSQERVLTLLYDKTFPPRTVAKETFMQEFEPNYNQMENLDEAIGSIYTRHFFSEESEDQQMDLKFNIEN